MTGQVIRHPDPDDDEKSPSVLTGRALRILTDLALLLVALPGQQKHHHPKDEHDEAPAEVDVDAE